MFIGTLLKRIKEQLVVTSTCPCFARCINARYSTENEAKTKRNEASVSLQHTHCAFYEVCDLLKYILCLFKNEGSLINKIKKEYKESNKVDKKRSSASGGQQKAKRMRLKLYKGVCSYTKTNCSKKNCSCIAFKKPCNNKCKCHC